MTESPVSTTLSTGVCGSVGELIQISVRRIAQASKRRQSKVSMGLMVAGKPENIPSVPQVSQTTGVTIEDGVVA
jgi:hypothetical protein